MSSRGFGKLTTEEGLGRFPSYNGSSIVDYRRICLNASIVFTGRSTVASPDERGDGELDDSPACAMDAAITPVLDRSEAENN